MPVCNLRLTLSSLQPTPVCNGRQLATRARSLRGSCRFASVQLAFELWDRQQPCIGDGATREASLAP
eukprot:4055500-Pleurochrysis_carterae.AAC.6